MSKWDKLLAKIINLSGEVRFEELQKVLESYGYEVRGSGTGGSHYTFRKEGCQPITIPRQRQAKKVYVEMVKKIIESEEKADENIG